MIIRKDEEQPNVYYFETDPISDELIDAYEAIAILYQEVEALKAKVGGV